MKLLGTGRIVDGVWVKDVGIMAELWLSRVEGVAAPRIWEWARVLRRTNECH